MAPKEDDFEPAENAEEFSDFVPAVFAKNLEEAEEYREILNDHDIPAIVGQQDGEDKPKSSRGMTRGLPVLVPEVLLDEASEIIADLEEDEDEDEFEDEDDEEEEDEEEDEDDEEEEDLFDDDELLGDEEEEEDEEDEEEDEDDDEEEEEEEEAD